MAIRRISDLPELLTHYQDANIDRCLLEVSYNDDQYARRYQSFYLKVYDLIEKIKNSEGGWVTLHSDQTIDSIKTFANGFIVTSPVYGSISINGIGGNESSIESQFQDHIPTCKAVYQYIEAQRFLQLPPDVPSDYYDKLIQMLVSMLSEQNMVIYVDHVYGWDDNDNKGESPYSPVKTFQRAIEVANQRRFIKNSSCFIRVINDYVLEASEYDASDPSKPNRINVYHPDLIQVKRMTIQGWGNVRDGEPDYLKKRTISFNCQNIQTPYEMLFECFCSTSFAWLDLISNAPPGAARQTAQANFGKVFYTIACSHGNDCYIEQCTFANMNYCIAGSGIGINNVAFTNCLSPIAASGANAIRTTFRGSISINQCSNFIVALNSSNVDVDWFFETKLDIQTYYTPISISTAANVTLYLYNEEVKDYYQPNLRAFVVKKLDPNTGSSIWYIPHSSQTGQYGDAYYISWMQFIRLLVYGDPNYAGERTDVGYTKDGYLMLRIKDLDWLTDWMEKGLQ